MTPISPSAVDRLFYSDGDRLGKSTRLAVEVERESNGPESRLRAARSFLGCFVCVCVRAGPDQPLSSSQCCCVDCLVCVCPQLSVSVRVLRCRQTRENGFFIRILKVISTGLE